MTLSQLTKGKNWSTPAPMPKLSDKDWSSVSLLGLVLLVMAALQLISFSEFKDNLTAMGLSSAGTWAIGLIIAEVWAALGFAKIRLSSAFRLVGNGLAILVAGFWAIENYALLVGGTYTGSSNFFGKYLSQTPSWWTAIEVTILVVWTLRAVHLVKNTK